LFDLAEYFQL